MNLLDEIINSEHLTRDGPPMATSLKERCAKDLKLFAISYFPHIFYKPFSSFHEDTFKDAQDLILEYGDQETYFVRAAPRSFGKSRIISVVFPLWCICFSYRRNILLISDTSPQAKEYIQTIKHELTHNEKLIADFGNLSGQKLDQTWKEDEIVTANGIHVFSKGAGQSLRGANYNNVRPEVVVLDDLESDEGVETEGQRNKLYRWFNKVLMPIGNERTCFLYVGSILHYESLLYKVLHDPKFNGWDRRVYKAVYEFSTSQLWDEWEKLYVDITNENARNEAYAFYAAHKDEMLEGTNVLWPGWKKDSYYKLMIRRLEDDESFNSEYQNSPMTEESRDFKEQWLIDNTYTELPEITEVYGAVDPSLGKTKKSDTSAIIMIGRGVNNYLYVLEADIKRRKPDDIIQDMIHHILKYYDKLKGFSVETDVWQDFFADTVQQRFVDRGMYVNWIKVQTQGNKEARIKSMIPTVKHGYLKFNKTHTTLWNQLKNWPKGHDDGVDCLEQCIKRFTAKAAICFDKMHVGRSREQRLPNVYSMMGRRR